MKTTIFAAIITLVSFNSYCDETPQTFEEALNSDDHTDLLYYYRPQTFEEALNSDDPSDLSNYYRK